MDDRQQQRDSSHTGPMAKGAPVPLTPQQLIDRVVVYEKDLAQFYDELRREPALKPLAEIFRFMAHHSHIHAEMIANYRSHAAIPQLDVTPLAILHERLKSSLKEELTASADSADAARKLAEAEEILGQAYAKIAGHYEALGDSYKMIASKFKSLSEDERQHGEYIRKHS